MIKHIILLQGDPRGKWTPTYEGPFVVKNIFSGGAMILITMDSDDLPHPVNEDIVKRYYVLYPKIFPPIFFEICQDQASKSLKGCTVQLPPNTVKIMVLVLAKKLRFSRVQSSPICLYLLSSIHMSSFKTHNIKLHSQEPYLVHNQLQG